MLKLENVSKTYPNRNGYHRVLDTINITVERGERVGILGLNGAGKSTLVRLIGGVEQPTSGKIHRSMRISWPIAFSGGFQTAMTGVDNLRFICRIYNTPLQPALAFVQEFSELGDYLYEPVKNYSAGMFARLSFAISMAIDFDCYLIDEVIAVGDQRFREKCDQELFGKRKDSAMLLVSHVPEIVKKHCQRVVVLDKGQAIEFIDVNDAYNYYMKKTHE